MCARDRLGQAESRLETAKVGMWQGTGNDGTVAVIESIGKSGMGRQEDDRAQWSRSSSMVRHMLSRGSPTGWACSGVSGCDCVHGRDWARSQPAWLNGK